MTAFLKLNGITVAVADGSAKHLPVVIGDMKRAVDGSQLVNRRAIKREFEFDVTLATAAEALALRDLILGRGHVVSFDEHLYTSKGLAPTSINGVTQQTSVKKYGAGALAVTVATPGEIQWPGAMPTNSPWTVSFWQRVDAGSWLHVVENSGGERWENGVSVGPAVGDVEVTAGGTLEIYASTMSGTTNYIDDLWATPFVWPSNWPAGVYALGEAVGRAPRLKASGLLVENNGFVLEVMGAVSELPLIQGTLGGVWHANLHRLAVRLSEV